MESAATTFASIAVLGIAGFSYHKYYKYLILQKMENAFEPGDPALEVAGVEVGKHQYHHDEHWFVRDEQPRIDKIISGEIPGHYFLLIGEKGTGKTSMLLEAMRKINGDGCAIFDAHGDQEIFRIRLGKALDFEFHEDYIGSLFSIKGPRDTTALLDIERAFNKLEKVAMKRRSRGKAPLVLIINSTHLVRDDADGQDLLEMIQQRAEQWAASNLVTTVFNSDDYWVYERLKRYATRMETIPVVDLPREKAMAALRKYRKDYFKELLSDEVLKEIYDKVGGRMSYLSRVAKAPDFMKLCNSICEAEKTWFLNKCWILGEEMDDDVMDQQKYASAAMVMAKALVDKEKEMDTIYDEECGHILPEISLHEARQIMTRADFIQSYDHDNIFTINSRAMVRADSVPMQHAFREVCSQPGFEEHLEATLDRISAIESLGRTRELTIKDLWDSGKYQVAMRDAKGAVIGMAPRKKDVVATTSPKKTYAEAAKEPPPKTLVEQIPSLARFFLVLISSLALSSTLFSLLSPITLGELGRVSQHLEEWWEVGGLVAWKAIEVALAWVLGFDGRDVLNFSFLIHLPTYALLSSFYGLRPTTVIASFAIVLVSTAAPFHLLRNPSSVHNLSRAPSSAVSNRGILQDWGTALATTALSTAIYTVTLYFSYATWLPAQLVVHFERLPNITRVHAGSAGLPILFLNLIPAGFAARDFLFVSSTGTPAAEAHGHELEKIKSALPKQGEFLASAIYRKTFGALSQRTRVLASRTVILATALLINTIIQVAGTINGASFEGASAWGFVWASGTVIVGLAYAWTEAVDGV
ncbi:ATP-binding protein [Aspergillus undulatus]|uniref:ATP-binding protein n=1 Tax=Aspergillus undulatus TaxID=1810928 RepID=UPI003CCD062B